MQSSTQRSTPRPARRATTTTTTTTTTRPGRGRPSAAERASEPYNLAEAGAEAARLAGATREEIAAAAAAAIAGKCSRYDASVIVSLVTMSAMLRRRAEEDDLRDIPTSSQSSSYTAALERARSRATAQGTSTRRASTAPS